MDINQIKEYEGLYICNDSQKTGLFAIIAVHSTALGPAIGGCRCVPYAAVSEAVNDAMLLAKAMSRKSSISGLPNGGAKAVIMRPAVIPNRKAFFERFGAFVESLGGIYYTAVDSGTDQEDLDIVATQTRYISAQVEKDAPPEATASWLTAQSVLSSMQAAAEFSLGSQDLSQLTIAIQGVGKVGGFLVDELVRIGANIVISETDSRNLSRVREKYPHLKVISPHEIVKVPCDIFAPCALGGVLTHHSILDLQANIICGAANNPLSSLEVANRLLAQGVTYVPDFVANAGGVILASMKLNGFDQKAWEQKAREMSDTTLTILRRSQSEGISTQEIACQMADERIALAGR